MKDIRRNLTMLFDFYELTMANGYFKSGMANQTVYFDVFYRKNPDKGGYAIAAGLEQIIEYIQDLKFDEEDIEYLRSKNIFDEEFLECFQLGYLQCPGKVEHNGYLGHLCGLESGESQVYPSFCTVNLNSNDRSECQQYHAGKEGEIGQTSIPSQWHSVAHVQCNQTHKYKLYLLYKERKVCSLLLICQRAA